VFIDLCLLLYTAAVTLNDTMPTNTTVVNNDTVTTIGTVANNDTVVNTTEAALAETTASHGNIVRFSSREAISLVISFVCSCGYKIYIFIE